MLAMLARLPGNGNDQGVDRESTDDDSEARSTLENMMIEAVVRGIDNNGTRPEVVEAEERNWSELHSG